MKYLNNKYHPTDGTYMQILIDLAMYVLTVAADGAGFLTRVLANGKGMGVGLGVYMVFVDGSQAFLCRSLAESARLREKGLQG